jgi:hypothetical protein
MRPAHPPFFVSRRCTTNHVGPDAPSAQRSEAPPESWTTAPGGVVHGRAQAQESYADGQARAGALSFARLGLALVPSSTHGLRRGLHSVAALRLKSEYWIAVSAQNSAPTRTSELYVKGNEGALNTRKISCGPAFWPGRFLLPICISKDAVASIKLEVAENRLLNTELERRAED